MHITNICDDNASRSNASRISKTSCKLLTFIPIGYFYSAPKRFGLDQSLRRRLRKRQNHDSRRDENGLLRLLRFRGRIPRGSLLLNWEKPQLPGRAPQVLQVFAQQCPVSHSADYYHHGYPVLRHSAVGGTGWHPPNTGFIGHQ